MFLSPITSYSITVEASKMEWSRTGDPETAQAKRWFKGVRIHKNGRLERLPLYRTRRSCQDIL